LRPVPLTLFPGPFHSLPGTSLVSGPLSRHSPSWPMTRCCFAGAQRRSCRLFTGGPAGTKPVEPGEQVWVGFPSVDPRLTRGQQGSSAPTVQVGKDGRSRFSSLAVRAARSHAAPTESLVRISFTPGTLAGSSYRMRPIPPDAPATPRVSAGNLHDPQVSWPRSRQRWPTVFLV